MLTDFTLLCECGEKSQVELAYPLNTRRDTTQRFICPACQVAIAIEAAINRALYNNPTT